jgi:hypothetical protein
MTQAWELRNLIEQFVALHRDQITALHNTETASNTREYSHYNTTALLAAQELPLYSLQSHDTPLGPPAT